MDGGQSGTYKILLLRKASVFGPKYSFSFCFHLCMSQRRSPAGRTTLLSVLGKCHSVLLPYLFVCNKIIKITTVQNITYSTIRVFCPRAGPSLQSTESKVAVLPKADLLPQTQEPRLQFYQGLNRCSSIPLLSAYDLQQQYN